MIKATSFGSGDWRLARRAVRWPHCPMGTHRPGEPAGRWQAGAASSHTAGDTSSHPNNTANILIFLDGTEVLRFASIYMFG